MSSPASNEVEKKREYWTDVIPGVEDRREGWEVDTAISLLQNGVVEIEGAEFDVEHVEPQIAFIEGTVTRNSESYHFEIHHTNNFGHSIQLHSDDVVISDE